MIALLIITATLVGSVLLGYYGRRNDRLCRWSDRLFTGLFTVFTAGAILWLAIGLIPAIVQQVPGAQRWFHDLAGGERSPTMRAYGPASFVQREMILQAGGTITLRLENWNHGRTHNLSIYRDSFFQDPIFLGGLVNGPAPGSLEPNVVTYQFPAPPVGTYYFRSDIYPQMNGVVSVVSRSNQGVVSTLARRIAVASLRPDAGGEFVGAKLRFKGQVILEYLASALNIILGVFLVRLRPRDWAARLLGLGMIGTAAVFNVQAHTGWLITPELGPSLHDNFHLISGFAYLYALLLFPDGKLALHWPQLGWFAWPSRLLFLAAISLIGLNASWFLHGGDPAGYLTFFGVIIPVTGIIAQALRVKHGSSPAGRQQSRVLMWSLVLALCTTLLFGLITLIFRLLGDSSSPVGEAELRGLAFAIFPPLFAVIPLTLFVILLRYRLWDIDRVINRTLVYGALTVILAAGYVGIVVFMQQIFGQFAGGSQLIIAVSTLIVAYLFRPLRARIQNLVDRRFNRQRYDAARTVEAFSARLRHQIELDTLADELRLVVQQTMQPSHVSLWLRMPGIPGEHLESLPVRSMREPADERR